MKITRSSFLALCLAFLMAMSVPVSAFATVEGDQTPLTDSEIEEALRSGEIDTEVEEFGPQPSVYASGTTLSAFSGADRYVVASKQAKTAYGTSSHAIVVGSEAWADALSAASLAGLKDCPILLTRSNSLTGTTQAALSDLHVSSVTVVGGNGSVSDGVVNTIKNMGISVDRIGGADRYEVQENIYKLGSNSNSWGNDLLIIASGANFPDALSVSPAAFKAKAPIVLCDQSGNLSGTQKQELIEAANNHQFSRVVIAGGPASVSTETESFAKVLASTVGGSATRFGGADRYEVAVNAANWFTQNGVLSWDGVALAAGTAPYDALCGSVLQGKRGSVMLLISENSSAKQTAYNALKANKGSIGSLSFFGGKGSVSSGIRLDVADVFGIPYYQIPEFKVYIDAGHGNNDNNTGVYDPGAIGSGYREADLTRDLANRVADSLKRNYGFTDAQIYLNTDGGWYKLRHAEAVAQGCDLIVSIHFNSDGGHGSESLIHSLRANWRSPGLQDIIHPHLIKGTKLTDRGQKTQQVAILGGQLPAVLLEVAFIDNSADMAQYMSRRDLVADHIASGIMEWAR